MLCNFEGICNWFNRKFMRQKEEEKIKKTTQESAPTLTNKISSINKQNNYFVTFANV
jgi:hypothetical protein